MEKILNPVQAQHNDYFRSTVQYLLVSFILLIIALLFSENLYGIFGNNNYIAIHLIIEIFIIIFQAMIAIQLLLTTRYSLVNKDIYTGALFIFFTIIEITHTIAYKGMPYFLREGSPYEATWFYIISRVLLPIGLLWVLMLDTKKISPLKRKVIIALSVMIPFLIIAIIYAPIQLLPLLVIEGIGTTLLKNILQYVALTFQLILVCYLIKHFSVNSKRYILVIVSSIYWILSDLLFTTYIDVYDFKNFMGHIFEFFAFAVLFKAIYYSSVEEPFDKLKEANEHLKQSREEVRTLAYYDEITKLPNERNLMEILKKMVNIGEKQKTIIVLEIDRLQLIKASLGTLYSEQMLRMVAERLKNTLPKNYNISKLRVEQFVIYVDGEIEAFKILQIGRDLQQMMETPFNVQHFSLVSSLNIGISQYPKDAQTEEDLIKHAQFAMYEASKIPEHILFFESTMNDVRTDRVLLENDLFKALGNNELFLEYQPQLDLKTGKITSLEALVRWKHPIKGLIPPLEFIPIAEQSGLIIPFGKWILETACRQTKELHEKIQQPIKVAVNLSLGQLYQENFLNVVDNVLKETGLSPEFLELEITESMTINSIHIIHVLEGLKKMGITIAIDDFGTGYSSLSYLKDFPIDCLKIDRIFVNNIQRDTINEPLVDTIISMAKHLKLKVVAEGIETIEQLNYLIDSKCDIVQGYLISKPITMDKLINKFHDIQNDSIKKMDVYSS